MVLVGLMSQWGTRLVTTFRCGCATTSQIGYTPLMEASSYGHLDVVTLLLDRGATIEAKSSVRRRAARSGQGGVPRGELQVRWRTERIHKVAQENSSGPGRR